MRQSYKMVKHTQTIRRKANCLSVFDHFVKLALKTLKFFDLSMFMHRIIQY